jgi:hypothetical protein
LGFVDCIDTELALSALRMAASTRAFAPSWIAAELAAPRSSDESTKNVRTGMPGEADASDECCDEREF